MCFGGRPHVRGRGRETGDMEVVWALVVWRHDHRVHLSPAASWKFTAQWKAEPTARLLRLWGRSLVIIDWIHQRQHDGSPHPPSRGESPNECKDISLHSRFRVLWIGGVFCLDRFLYWLVLIILSWTFPCPTHSVVVTPTQAGKLSPKATGSRLCRFHIFVCWQLWMETGICPSQQTEGSCGLTQASRHNLALFCEITKCVTPITSVTAAPCCCRTSCQRSQSQSLARRWLLSQSPNKNLADMLHCLLCAQ